MENEVAWILAWTAAMLVTPVAGLMKLEELDPRGWMGLAVVEQDWGQAVMVLQQVLWPVELELVEWAAVGKEVALENSPEMTAGVPL